MNEPCESQELIAYVLLGGITDKRILLKDGADETLSGICERKAHEARDRESDRLQHAALGSAGLSSPPHSTSAGAGTRPAGKLQWSDQPGRLSSGQDRGVLR